MKRNLIFFYQAAAGRETMSTMESRQYFSTEARREDTLEKTMDQKKGEEKKLKCDKQRCRE